MGMLMLGVVSGLFISPSTVMAAWQRQHASSCYMQNSLNAAYYNENSGLVNNTGYQQTFICAYTDNSVLPRTNVWTLNLHGQKNTPNGQDSAWACVKYWNAYSWVCGIGTTVTNNTPWTMPLFADYWRGNPGDFAYIKATLQPGSGIFGFYAAE